VSSPTRTSPTSSSELLLRQRLGALRRTLSAASLGDVRAIHQARVATRRLREALPLVRAGKAGVKLEKVARKLTRALGPVRELDVNLISLDEIRQAGGTPTRAITYLRAAIADERRRMHQDLARTLSTWDLDKLQRKAIERLREEPAAPTTSRRDPERIAVARRRAALRAAGLREMVDDAGTMYLSDRLHNVRIAVKKLRYALEVVRDLSGSRATARILALKKVQELLGRMHDLEVLISRTRAIQASAAPDLKLSGELDGLVRRLENECRQLHGTYITARARLLEICDRVIDAGQPRQDSAA